MADFLLAATDLNSKSQHAGGMLLPPVQKLVATIIFAIGENANKSAGSSRKRSLRKG